MNTKFKMWRIDQAIIGDTSEHDAVRESYEIAKAYRAEVIDAATLVELELDDVLCDYFIGCEPAKRERFKAGILTTEACGYFQKWKMIRHAVNTESEWAESAKISKRTALIKELKDLIGHRNAFAHGELVVSASTKNCSLSYFEGERKTVEVTEEFIASILSEAKEVFKWLSEIHFNFEVESGKF